MCGQKEIKRKDDRKVTVTSPKSEPKRVSGQPQRVTVITSNSDWWSATESHKNH